jgi:hypothetical protein
MHAIATLGLATCLILGLAWPEQEPIAKKPAWKQVASFELHYETLKPPVQGIVPVAMRGAGVISFWIEDRHAAAIDVQRADGSIGIFIGVAAEKPHEETMAKSMRVRFTTKSGKTTDVPYDASGGGAVALLFCSPHGLEAGDIESFQVLYDENADWVKR